MFFVYVIQSQSTGRFYVGSTKNILDRVNGHNSGKTPSTRNRGPWELVYSEGYETKSEAIKRENAIKRKKSKKYIINLIQGNP